MHIFNMNQAGSNIDIANSLRLYSFTLTRNGVLVRDLIPVEDKAGVVCLYDKVSKTYLYNAGTGSFIAGPEID